VDKKGQELWLKLHFENVLTGLDLDRNAEFLAHMQGHLAGSFEGHLQLFKDPREAAERIARWVLEVVMERPECLNWDGSILEQLIEMGRRFCAVVTRDARKRQAPRDLANRSGEPPRKVRPDRRIRDRDLRRWRFSA